MTIIRADPSARPHCPHVDKDRELIHVDCASHVYPDGSIGIHNMCFYVQKDEIVALCGPNGSGKSTLIEHLNGLLVPTEGNISVNGRSITKGEHSSLWQEVGIVFQQSDDHLFAPTVIDDVMFGPINMGMPRDTAQAAAMQALEAVGAAGLVNKLPNYLSGGQKRLISIAGILAMRPRVIALNEPTSDLDPVHCERIEQLILNLKQKFGIIVVIATHDMDLAARIADRICLVRNGSVFAEGPPAEIFYELELLEETGLRPPHITRTYLSYCRIQQIIPDRHPLSLDEMIVAIRPE